MKSVFTAKVLLLAAFLISCTTATADTIKGKIEFVKKPPFTGILYIGDSGGDKKQPMIDQQDKAFTTKIAVGIPNDIIKFSNSDTFDHNIYANDAKQKVKFDVGLMTPGHSTKLKMVWPDDSLVRIGCKIHPKMRSYVANINSRFYHAFQFTKKVKSYQFSIAKVPDDKSQLTLIMPKYDKLTIELKKGESKTVEVKRKGKVKATLTLSRD
jgi:hypothetical protein